MLKDKKFNIKLRLNSINIHEINKRTKTRN